MKCKTAYTATKDERIPVNDAEGHQLALQIFEGLAFFENGEIAKVRVNAIVDAGPGGAQAIAYQFFTFDDGSTMVFRRQRSVVADKPGTWSAQTTAEIVKGTGRFEGIQGTSSATGKNFLPTKEEPARITDDVTITYTLPTK